MHKYRYTFPIIGFAILPYIVGLFADYFILHVNRLYLAGLGVSAVPVVVGIPLVLTVGLAVSAATTKRVNSKQLALLGYAIPSVLVSAGVVLFVIAFSQFGPS